MTTLRDTLLGNPVNALRYRLLREDLAERGAWFRFTSDFWTAVSKSEQDVNVTAIADAMRQADQIMTWRSLSAHLYVPQDDPLSDLALAASIKREYDSLSDFEKFSGNPALWSAIINSPLLDERLKQVQTILGEASNDLKYLWGPPASGFYFMPSENSVRLDPLQVLTFGPDGFTPQVLEVIHLHRLAPSYPKPVKTLVDLSNQYSAQADAGTLTQENYETWMKVNLRAQMQMMFWEACEHNMGLAQAAETLDGAGINGKAQIQSTLTIAPMNWDMTLKHRFNLAYLHFDPTLFEPLEQLALIARSALAIREGIIENNPEGWAAAGLKPETCFKGMDAPAMQAAIGAMVEELAGDNGTSRQVPNPLLMFKGEETWRQAIQDSLEDRGQRIHQLWLRHGTALIEPLEKFTENFARASVETTTVAVSMMEQANPNLVSDTIESANDTMQEAAAEVTGNDVNVVDFAEALRQRGSASVAALASVDMPEGAEIKQFSRSPNGTENDVFTEWRMRFMEAMMSAEIKTATIRLADGRYAGRPQNLAETPADQHRSMEKAFFEALKKYNISLKRLSELTRIERPKDEEPERKWGGRAGFGAGYGSLADGDFRDYAKTREQFWPEIMRLAQRLTTLLSFRIMNEVQVNPHERELFNPEIHERLDMDQVLHLGRQIERGVALEEDDIHLFREEVVQSRRVEFSPAFVFAIDLSGSMGSYGRGSPLTLALNSLVVLSEACQQVSKLLPYEAPVREGESHKVVIPTWAMAFGPPDPPMIYSPEDDDAKRGANIHGAGFGLASGTLLSPCFAKTAKLLGSYVDAPDVGEMQKRAISSLHIITLSDGDIYDTDAVTRTFGHFCAAAPQVTFSAIVVGGGGQAMINAFDEGQKVLPMQVGKVIRLGNTSAIADAVMDEVARLLQHARLDVSANQGIQADRMKQAAGKMAEDLNLG